MDGKRYLGGLMLKSLRTRLRWCAAREAVVSRRFARLPRLKADANMGGVGSPRDRAYYLASIRANMMSTRLICDPRHRHKLTYILFGVPFGLETSV